MCKVCNGGWRCTDAYGGLITLYSLNIVSYTHLLENIKFSDNVKIILRNRLTQKLLHICIWKEKMCSTSFIIIRTMMGNLTFRSAFV